MEELAVKKEFTDIYTQETPYEYLKEMRNLHYRIPNHTKPLYLSLADQLYEKLQRPLNIVDIGSSYGINSALMKYDVTMQDLDELFIKENTPTITKVREFLEKQPENKKLNFYQIDISGNALKFSEKAGLCKKGIHVNLETEKLMPPKELDKIDMVIATGCIGYIGYKAFSNLLEAIKNQRNDSEITPIFAFSALRIFSMEKIKQTFDYYGYSLVKCEVDPIRQRNFSDADEMAQTISLLREKGVDTIEYEDGGSFYADFYVACPKKTERHLIAMSEIMKNDSQ